MKKVILGCSMVLAVACGQEGGSSIHSLSVGEGSVEGTFWAGDDLLEFSSVEVEAGVYDVVVTGHGMMLATLLEPMGQVAEMDGFAMADGGDTQVLEEDREVLRALLAELRATLDLEDGGAADVLGRMLSQWSETPTSVPLQRTVMGEEDRGWTSYCGSYGAYVAATHDGWGHSRWDSDATSYGKVGSVSGYGCTRSNHNGWTCSEPDHKRYPSQYGECFGNCGAGCPGGNQTLTRDCHDHDQCVRNGHALASAWCNDEFVSASDDELFATRCGGTYQ